MRGLSGVDAHCHLDAFPNPAAIVEQCRQLRVIFTCGYSHETSLKALALAREFSGFVFPVVGISPQEAMKPEANFHAALRLLEEKEVVAVGEIGLDYHWGKTSSERARQLKCFRLFLRAAVEKNLPVVIHSRKAEGECVRILAEERAEQVMLHCFSGKPALALEAADRGWLVSIPPSPSGARKKFCRRLALERLVVESDAPFIGKRPIDILKPAALIASEKQLPVGEVVEATGKNSIAFFRV